MILGESHGGLGRRHRIARISDQGRPLEQGTDRGDVRAFESNLGEPVLGDLNAARQPAASACAAAASGRPSGRNNAPRPRPTFSKKRRAGPRQLPSFPFYPRCSSPVGGLQKLKTRLLHMPRRAIRAPESNAAATCACPRRRAETPGAGQKVRTAFTRPGSAGRIEKLGLPRLCWLPGLDGALGIKRVPEGLRAGSLGQDMAGRRRKGLPFPSSGLSAAPASITRHRFDLRRAVAMFDHWGRSAVYPDSAHSAFGRLARGYEKFIAARSDRSRRPTPFCDSGLARCQTERRLQAASPERRAAASEEASPPNHDEHRPGRGFGNRRAR